jgi:hypothetical protein
MHSLAAIKEDLLDLEREFLKSHPDFEVLQ